VSHSILKLAVIGVTVPGQCPSTIHFSISPLSIVLFSALFPGLDALTILFTEFELTFISPKTGHFYAVSVFNSSRKLAIVNSTVFPRFYASAFFVSLFELTFILLDRLKLIIARVNLNP
jgi:hypothetical protein